MGMFQKRRRVLEEDRQRYIKFSSWRLLVTVSRVPKTILGFDDSQKGLIGLRKAILCVHDYGLLQ